MDKINRLNIILIMTLLLIPVVYSGEWVYCQVTCDTVEKGLLTKKVGVYAGCIEDDYADRWITVDTIDSNDKIINTEQIDYKKYGNDNNGRFKHMESWIDFKEYHTFGNNIIIKNENNQIVVIADNKKEEACQNSYVYGYTDVFIDDDWDGDVYDTDDKALAMCEVWENNEKKKTEDDGLYNYCE